ncbi:hypothetical protein DMA12_35200 [Amycolatopsis balhimycina DSM 5908]|uniref:Uncharacterized protein n=1 Tax=Amycolatopsis balhimycina DSM 5908 TaxID=1081091 RepID=A0A428W420_AMYBA|nr:hypothetical protein DMA12_35200 [Amycolatopsis balhimycina DSM 5908]
MTLGAPLAVIDWIEHRLPRIVVLAQLAGTALGFGDQRRRGGRRRGGKDAHRVDWPRTGDVLKSVVTPGPRSPDSNRCRRSTKRRSPSTG